MSYNPKVVSFERSAAYVHHRAMKNRRDNNPVDALELMRQAVRQNPDNQDYKLDLAEMYCEMGCHERSNRILLDMLAQPNAPAECYYGLALNQLGRNEPDSARRAIALYRRHKSSGEYLEDAKNILAEMDFFDDMSRNHSRRKGRAARFAERACDAMKYEDPKKALQLLERSLELDPDRNENRVLYAMALRMDGQRDAALAEVQRSVAAQNTSVRTLCAAAEMHYMCGDAEAARELAQRALELHPVDVELKLLIFTLSILKMYDEAAEAARLALQGFPYDRQLLHMRAVCLHRAGASDDKLASFWARILRIDPSDSIAGFYHEAALANRLAEVDPTLPYTVPAEEAARRASLIAQKLSEGLEAAVAQWRSDADFRELLLWAVGTGDENCGRAAIMVIASAGDAESESAIRELLYRGDVPIEVKLHGVLFLRMRGADMQKLMPPDMDLQDGMLPEAKTLLAALPACERQLVRLADDVLREDHGINACSALCLMWRAYRAACKGTNDPLVSTQEAAAALAWNYLLVHGQRVSPRKLARQFACRVRRMVFYARHMADVLERYEGKNEKDEDH